MKTEGVVHSVFAICAIFYISQSSQQMLDLKPIFISIPDNIMSQLYWYFVTKDKSYNAKVTECQFSIDHHCQRHFKTPILLISTHFILDIRLISRCIIVTVIHAFCNQRQVEQCQNHKVPIHCIPLPNTF